MKKRVLSLLLALVMVVGLLPMAVMAAGETVKITVEADKTTVDQDAEVTFKVYLQSTENLGGVQVYLDIPADMTYVAGSGKLTDGLAAQLAADGDVSFTEAKKMINIASTTAFAGITTKTEIATFKCTAPKGGNFSVGVSFTGPDEGDVGMVTNPSFDAIEDTKIALTPVALTVNKTRQTLGSLTLAYDPTTIAISGTNLSGTATATVTAKDDEGDAMDLAKVTNLTFVTDPATVTGVKIAADGKITVDKTVTAGEFKVKAKAGSVESAEVTITVTKEASAVTEVLGAANNPTTALIPTSEDSVDYTYAVDVLDQYGAKMTGEAVTWAVEGDLPTGVTFDATTAKLTVAKTAESGPVVLKATVDTKTATINVNVTNISFTGVDEGVKASDGVYGAKLSDLVKIDASKITATAGATVAGKYTLKDADTVPAAADEVAYEVVFNSNDETYKDIPVASGTVKVAPKEIVVTAKDVTVRVRTDVADVKAEYGYENTELVGDDELTGTPGYTLYALNEDGTVSSTVVTLSDEVMEQPAEFALVVAGLDVPNANYTITFSNAGRLEIRKKSLGIPEGSTKPDDPNKDPDAEKLVFDDVVEGDWFYDAVNYVAENKLMNGTAEKTFAPHANTSRAMIATILWRQAGSPEPRARIADFPDVVDGSWYADAVRWCAEKEIVTGYEDGTFGPDNEITREQLAAMLYRYAGSPEVDAAMGMAGFEDVETISAWAADAMRWAVQNGIMNGKNGTLLDPQGLATRAETAAMFQRYLSKK